MARLLKKGSNEFSADDLSDWAHEILIVFIVIAFETALFGWWHKIESIVVYEIETTIIVIITIIFIWIMCLFSFLFKFFFRCNRIDCKHCKRIERLAGERAKNKKTNFDVMICNWMHCKRIQYLNLNANQFINSM